jgi:hypothetical protein
VNPRQNPKLSKTIGQSDTKSRAKAEQAHERQEISVDVTSMDGWPRNNQGHPLARITMQASELLPTGQYANVAVGPAQITIFIDPESDVEYDEEGKPHLLTDETKQVLAVGLNELAQIVESDVIAVQRNLVLESLQDQVESKETK